MAMTWLAMADTNTESVGGPGGEVDLTNDKRVSMLAIS